MDGGHVSPSTNRIDLRGFDRRTLDYSMLGATVARHMQIGAGQLHASIERLRFNSLAMRVSEFSAAVQVTVEPPRDTVTLGVVLQTNDPLLIQGRPFRADTMSVFAAGRPSEVRYPAGSRSVTLAMPAAVCERELLSAPLHDALGAADVIPQVQVSRPDIARLHDILREIEMLAARDAGLWLDSHWTANAERALLDAFFRPLGEPASIDLARSNRYHDARTTVRAVEARLDADPASLPSIPVLCADLRISRRTLERAFRDLLDVSPAHYLRLRSLNAVRDALLQCRPEPGIVTRIAIGNGFWHLGRFSSAYRALFGERPIDTLRRTHGNSLVRQDERLSETAARRSP